jgi:hypothetical protein
MNEGGAQTARLLTSGCHFRFGLLLPMPVFRRYGTLDVEERVRPAALRPPTSSSKQLHEMI